MKHIIFLLLISIGVNAQTVTKWAVCYPKQSIEFADKQKAINYCAGKCDSIHKVVIDLTTTEYYKDSVEDAKRKILFSAIKQTAQSAVGIKYDALSITQIRALYAIDLFYKGAFDSTLKVRPLKEWVKN